MGARDYDGDAARAGGRGRGRRPRAARAAPRPPARDRGSCLLHTHIAPAMRVPRAFGGAVRARGPLRPATARAVLLVFADRQQKSIFTIMLDRTGERAERLAPRHGAGAPAGLSRPSCCVAIIATRTHTSLHATFIPPRKYPIPSELGSQAWLGQTSTGLRDHLGTPGDVVFCRPTSRVTFLFAPLTPRARRRERIPAYSA